MVDIMLNSRFYHARYVSTSALILGAMSMCSCTLWVLFTASSVSGYVLTKLEIEMEMEMKIEFDFDVRRWV